jgi:hypothetical protein
LCKALDSVFPCLPESVNILDPTDYSDIKILKDIGLCVDDIADADAASLETVEEFDTTMVEELQERAC